MKPDYGRKNLSEKAAADPDMSFGQGILQKIQKVSRKLSPPFGMLPDVYFTMTEAVHPMRWFQQSRKAGGFRGFVPAPFTPVKRHSPETYHTFLTGLSSISSNVVT